MNLTKILTIMFFTTSLITSGNISAQPNLSQEKIAVIGAGLAGLTFAYRLQQKGYDVELYEARPRVGGRVHTVYVKNLDGGYSSVELGGQNFDDGGDANNISSLIEEFNLKVLSVNVSRKRFFYDGRGFHDLRQLGLANFPFSEEEIRVRLEKCKNAVSIKDIMDQMFPDGSISPEEKIMKRIFSSSISSYEGSTVEKLATYHNLDILAEMMYTPKEQQQDYWTLKHLEKGNSSLTSAIAEKLGKRVHLNKVLQKVSRAPNNTILLHFRDGEEVTCSRLILAIPAPVYEDIEFLDGTIPAERLKLINKVQYGNNTKAIVPVKYQDNTIRSIYTDNLAESGKSLVTWLNEDEKLLTLYFAGYGSSEGIKERLYDKAVELIKLYHSDKISLKKGEPVIPIEENFAKHDTPIIKLWIQDPYSKGSYSSYGVALGSLYDETVSYKGTKIKTIFKPIDGRIFFIGEHTTIIPEVGTMEAAVESAERIARVLHDIMK